MGGLVAKKAYILAREDPSAKELASRIHTLYFLATPHRGSDLTKILMNIMKVSFGQKAFVGELDRNSASIDSINDSFRHHAEDLQLWSFYETVPSSLILTSTLIVDKASATLGYAKERTSLLNADHRGVCKFDLPGDPNYKTLRNAFVTTIDAILSEISQAISETSKLQHNQLVDLTGITEPPVNDLVALEDLRADGSCGWLMSKQIYSSWRTPWSDSRAIFWLTGNAGSGKSVLCSQIINDLQKQNLRCSYFFFKHGSGVESTIAGCLRALAYQLAKSDEAVLRKVLHIEKDALPCTQWDERTLWRKLFVGCIFKVSKPLPQYWVIDGLDECPKFSTFVSLTAKAPSCLRMFFTSCTTPEAEKSLVSLGSLVEHYQMQGQDTLDDLGIFIDSRMNRLPAGDEQGQMKLRNKLLEKSSGSFLWVSLIVQELEQAYSEEVAEEVLDEVPEDMNRLYARMLENLPQNERAMRLAKAIFMWTLFSFWALTVSEMQCAVKLDSNQTVHNLGRSISAICGQLLGVDQSNRVHSIHQTTQVFLLQQDIVPSLAMDRQESHTRIAQSCLKLLANNNFAQATRLHKTNGALALAPDLKLVEYACVYFSDHLQKCSSDDQTAWDLLCKFLDSNVPSWIESLSVKGRLSRGSIQIFEFGGSEGEKLLPIHRIDAYEDGIRSIAFGSDSLRFADIRVSQCRVWEPVVLVRSEVGDGSQSEISQAVTLVPKSVGMLEGPQDPEITAVCHDHSGGFVFCGKEDGAVVCFETQNATQLGILYRHAVNVRISSIAYSEQGRILVSADESGRVLVNTISPSENTSDMITALSEIRSQESITALMLDPAGARMLVQGNKYAHVWTIAGEKVGSPITTTDDDGTHDILIHLSKTESFIIIGSQDTRTYSWTDGREMHPPSRDTFGTTSFEVTPPSPIHPQVIHLPDPAPSDSSSHHRPANFIAHLSHPNPPPSSPPSTPSKLEIWPTSTLPPSSALQRPEPLPDPENLGAKVRQVIAVPGNQLLFLDKDNWVCSHDLAKLTLSASAVTRHFFLLSEWQSGGGGFFIDYLPVKREFAIAFKDCVLVVKKGLENVESWCQA
ncbi:MAG: hypothetical protein Q9201_006059 [Fulgogasparrea decipioides]